MKNRIEWIDEARGLAMLMVVYVHISYYCFGIRHDASFSTICNYVMLPLFFFISGFLVNVSKILSEECWKLLWMRFRIWVIAAFCVMLLNASFRGIDLTDAFVSNNKIGYWFTFSLFQFYILISCLFFFLRKCSRTTRWVVICLSAIVVYIVGGPLLYQKLNLNETFVLSAGFLNLRWYLFFVFGVYVKEHKRIIAYLANKYITTICICVFLLSVFYKDFLLEYMGEHFFWNSVKFSGLLILIAWFNSAQWNKMEKTKSFFRQIGRYTLEIYWFHWFLMPYTMSVYMKAFNTTPMPL